MRSASRSWEDFSFVASSGYRERVLQALAGKPKFPTQLADDTGLRLGHVSRALREMRMRGIVVCLNPEVKARGRLYGLTDSGSALLQFLGNSSRRFVPTGARGTPYIGFIPKIRASTVLRFLTFLRRRHGREADDAIRNWGIRREDLEDDTWLSVDACAELLELIESKFGDGSYGFIRAAFRDAVGTFPTIREQLARALPLEVLAEHAPAVYNREWNFGRLEVEAGPGHSVNRHFDWMPTPAMCAMFHGVYEGVLVARHVPGKVTKTQCVRRGDPCCEYRVEWGTEIGPSRRS